jgi:hypothetical protein
VSEHRSGPLAALGVLAVAIAVASCGGVAPSAKSLPSDVRLPSPAALCPPVGELDYYVTVPPRTVARERSTDNGTNSSVTCSYGDLSRLPRTSVVVSYELLPKTSTRYPAGVRLHRIHDVGDWALSYREGHVTRVVVDEGYVVVSVSSDAGVSDLLGLAEEELARVPITDRS